MLLLISFSRDFFVSFHITPALLTNAYEGLIGLDSGTDIMHIVTG